MRKMYKVAVAGLLVVSVAGCAAEIGTAIGMQIQRTKARGEPIDLYRNKFGRESEQATTLNGQPAYVWNLSYEEMRTVEAGSYAYHNTDRPGMTTGITYEDRQFSRECILTIAYDERTQLVTDLHLTNDVTCIRVRESLMDVKK